MVVELAGLGGSMASSRAVEHLSGSSNGILYDPR